MTVYAALSLVLVAAIVALGVRCAVADTHGKALVLLQLAGPVGTALLLLIGLQLGRGIFFELPLVWALMSLIGVVAFLRLQGDEL